MNSTAKRRILALLCAMMTIIMAMGAGAEGLSDDNSLAALGITTEGAVVSPEFSYDVWTYTVTVPAGTTELTLEPHTTNPSATINSISGTELDENGNGTVVITVTSESGNAIEYTLNVSTEDTTAQEDPATAIAQNEASMSEAPAEEAPAELQTEVQTEDPRYVKVDRNSLEEAENTIERLQSEITVYQDRMHVFTYVIYALIAVSVLLLFLVIHLLLHRKDAARAVKELRRSEEQNLSMQSAQDEWKDEWDDWGEEQPAKQKKNKKRKKGKGAENQQPVNAQTSWTQTQVGTPVEPRRVKEPVSEGPAAREAKRNKKKRKNKNTVNSDVVKTVRVDDATRRLNQVSRAKVPAADTAQQGAEAAKDSAQTAQESYADMAAQAQAQATRRISDDEIRRAQAAGTAAETAAEKAQDAANAVPAPTGDVQIDMIDL